MSSITSVTRNPAAITDTSDDYDNRAPHLNPDADGNYHSYRLYLLRKQRVATFCLFSSSPYTHVNFDKTRDGMVTVRVIRRDKPGKEKSMSIEQAREVWKVYLSRGFRPTQDYGKKMGE